MFFLKSASTSMNLFLGKRKIKKVEMKVYFGGAFEHHGSQPNFPTQTVKHSLRCSISFRQATPPGIWPRVRWKSGNCFLFRVNFRSEPLARLPRAPSIFWSAPPPPPRFRWLASDCSLRSRSAPSDSEQLELRRNRRESVKRRASFGVSADDEKSPPPPPFVKSGFLCLSFQAHMRAFSRL